MGLDKHEVQKEGFDEKPQRQSSVALRVYGSENSPDNSELMSVLGMFLQLAFKGTYFGAHTNYCCREYFFL